MQREVVFDFSCTWDVDQVNKLFGFGYFPSHHKESARFGWMYNIGNKKFTLSAYCYVNGHRIITNLCHVVANRKYVCRIEKHAKYYTFSVIQKENGAELGRISIPYEHNKKLGYKLGLYFGGKQPAPATMKIEIK